MLGAFAREVRTLVPLMETELALCAKEFGVE
jgi:hypothetical protein